MTARDPATARSLMEVAERLADAARIETLRYFRRADLTADSKETARFDPVTIADRAAEQAMRKLLAELRPEDAILGEEFGTQAGTSGLTWVLDPIDGTRGYMSGTPTWGVLVGLVDQDGPVLGIIDQPYIGERLCGAAGIARITGPMGEGKLQTRPARPLSEAVIYSTFPEVGSKAEGEAFHRLASQCRLTRYGMDCYAYGLVAAGQIDLVVEAGLQTYDVVAPIAVIQAAGGVVTDWKGGPAHQGGRILAAANPAIHAEALAILSQAPDT